MNISTIQWKDIKKFNNIECEEIRYISTSKRSLWKLDKFIISIQGVKFIVENSPLDYIPKGFVNQILYNRLKDEKVEINNFFENIIKITKITK